MGTATTTAPTTGTSLAVMATTITTGTRTNGAGSAGWQPSWSRSAPPLHRISRSCQCSSPPQLPASQPPSARSWSSPTVTIGTIVGLTLAATSGGYQIRGQWLDRWGNAITALVLVVIGALVLSGTI